MDCLRMGGHGAGERREEPRWSCGALLRNVAAPPNGASDAERVCGKGSRRAPKVEMDLLLHSFIAVSTLGILACLLALCTLCRRKHSKQALPQDSVRLVDGPTSRITELSESATKPQKLKKADSQGKNRRSASFNLQLPPREEDGTASVSSFTVFLQRQLPQIPSEDLSAAEETYSNLTFPSQAQEILYESVTLQGGEIDQPSLIEVEEGLPGGCVDQATGAEYARVLKVKNKEETPPLEAGGFQDTPPQSRPAQMAANPQIPQVEEMYSVVNKAGKKKKTTDLDGDVEEGPRHIEMNHQNGQLAVVTREPDRAEPQPSPSLSPVTEPCYDLVSREPWLLPAGREVAEPEYETVDAHWKPSRRKGKASLNKPENLYESI